MKGALIVAFTLHSFSLGRDSWTGADKAKHFFLGAFAQSVAFGGLRSTGLSRGASIAGASVFSLAVITGKELHDRTGAGTPSVRDAIWGAAGAAAISPLLLRSK